MANRIPEYLKLHVEETADARGRSSSVCDRLNESFCAATGWQLRYSTSSVAPPPTGISWLDSEHSSQVEISIDNRNESSTATAPRESVMPLASVLGDLLTDLQQVREALRHREAELAAAVPVVSVSEDQQHLADRLEAVLRGAAQILGCQAAGLYMLDEATSYLKIRAAWGMPEDSYLAAPRPLAEAVADIEALAGHAIVIDDTRLLPHWNIPAEFASAICVPVSSATMILGTLWLFCDRSRDFSAHEQDLAETIAGRLAADLERNVLLQEVVAAKANRRESDDLSRWHRTRTPQAPLVEGWDVAGSCTRDDQAADFFHWHLRDDDQLALTVASMSGSSIVDTIGSISLQATVRAHLQYPHRVSEFVDLVNRSVWSGSAGDEQASLVHAQIDPAAGTVCYAAAGPMNSYILRPHGWEPLEHAAQPLGVDEEWPHGQLRQIMVPGDVLLMFSDLSQIRGESNHALANQIAETLLHNTHLSAERMADKAAEMLRSFQATGEGRNLAVLVARRPEHAPA